MQFYKEAATVINLHPQAQFEILDTSDEYE